MQMQLFIRKVFHTIKMHIKKICIFKQLNFVIFRVFTIVQGVLSFSGKSPEELSSRLGRIVSFARGALRVCTLSLLRWLAEENTDST